MSNQIQIEANEPLSEASGLIRTLMNGIRGAGRRAVVAFSGGVDSSVVACTAARALGSENALCVVARSESNTADDVRLCRAIARAHNLRLEVIEYSELAIPNYSDNPVNRCYFCKNELYTRLSALAKDRGFDVVLDGTNADDAGDYRPGMRALTEHRVVSPLLECGIGKAAVRRIAREMGLPNHDKPSAPCLSSRVPYGQEITKEKLSQIAEAEKYLRGLGLKEFRCRHHDKAARIEATPDQFPLLLEHRDEIVATFKRIGFLWVSMDLAGFRSGSLNDVLKPNG